MMSFGRFTWGGGGLTPTPTLYATFTLPNTRSLIGRRSRNQRCEPPQVLSNGGQNKLVLSASWTTQSQPAELQDTLEVRERGLDGSLPDPSTTRPKRAPKIL
jgi:hypothetical protein